MPKLKPWFHVVTPREDLRSGRPLDASEFAVHLDHIRDGCAPPDYQDPARFFERTYPTRSLKDLGAQTLRRLAGITVETSAVFSLVTQFGGGKTHSLALLYHLAKGGPGAEKWQGVKTILDQAQVKNVPAASTAVFVGTEFDALSGRGGGDEPRRLTPWGEIAWQLGGAKAFQLVAEHDERRIAPAGDVIRAFLPEGPVLILMDELLNYISAARASHLSAQFYHFLQSLSETVRGRNNVVLAVAIPASKLEMMPEDYRDHDSLEKMLDRVGKAIMMSAETEIAEIIRRRLFEWGGLDQDAKTTALTYANWVVDHRQLIGDFDVDSAHERFLACYPFHPALLSVFERKWQALPRFQKTRGILRLLALWISYAHREDNQKAYRDPLIGLGTAPVEDPTFRAAMLDQLGNRDLEVPLTTDIAGKKEAHSLRLDREAKEALKKARLHQKVATVIFFESNGGQTRDKATVPEIRLAVAEPDLDVANVETALETLVEGCYYLRADNNRYWFSLTPNLNKIHTDRRASVKVLDVEERVKQVVQEVFKVRPAGVDWVPFAKESSDVPDRPALTLVLMAPDRAKGDPSTRVLIEQIVREHGKSARTFKSALLFAVSEDAGSLRDEARDLLAWESIAGDTETVKRLDDGQRRQLETDRGKAARDLKESVWHTYRYVLLLGKNDALEELDLGMVHSSSATSLPALIVERLKERDAITDSVGASKLLKYWPPALAEWPTKGVRDVFFSSPICPRLLVPDSLRQTIADGVNKGLFGYAVKIADGQYESTQFKPSVGLTADDIDISVDAFLLTAERAKQLVQPPHLARVEVKPTSTRLKPKESVTFAVTCYDQHDNTFPSPTNVIWSCSGGAIDAQGRFTGEAAGTFSVGASVEGHQAAAFVEVTDGTPPPPPRPQIGFSWQGTLPPLRWMNFYTKVLSSLVSTPGLKLEVRFEVPAGDTANESKVEATKSALRELGLSEDVEVQSG